MQTLKKCIIQTYIELNFGEWQPCLSLYGDLLTLKTIATSKQCQQYNQTFQHGSCNTSIHKRNTHEGSEKQQQKMFIEKINFEYDIPFKDINACLFYFNILMDQLVSWELQMGSEKISSHQCTTRGNFSCSPLRILDDNINARPFVIEL